MKQFLKSLVIALTVFVVVGAGCTENYRAKHLGGTMKASVPADREFMNVTWKDDDLWILSKPRTPGHVPTTYLFKADTSFGVMEGAVEITEEKSK